MNVFRIQTAGWRLAAAALLLWGLPRACFAANDYWTNSAGGSFSNAVNWSPGLPGAADAAYFTNAASYTVNWSAGASNANVYYDAGGGGVTQNMGSATWVVTGLYDVGQTSGKTGVVVQVGGYVHVTNVADSVRIGDSGNGSYTLNGGVLVARNTLVGYLSDNNTMLVTGSGAVMTNTSYTYIGSSGSGNLFTLANSGMVVTAYGVIGPTAGKNGNRLVITDPGTVWTNTASAAGTPFRVGDGAAANSLVVSNGGQLFSTYTSIGSQAKSSNNSALVTGTGSTWTVVGSSSTIRVGESGSSNQLTIANGGKMVLPNHFYVGYQASSSNNLVTVTGAGSVLTNAPNMDVVIGQSGVGNRLVVSNGGKVYMSNGFAILGANASSSSNTALITDTGSLWRNSTRFDIGQNGSKDNTLVVSNGGQMVIGGISYLGETVASTGNRVILTGAGSLYQAGGAFNVGSNATTKGAASVLVTDGATLEASTLVGGWNGTGTITNVGGVYQFTTAAPTLTPNTAGSLLLTNGTISFSNINNADVQGSKIGALTNLLFQGNNTFRLNAASNATANQAYTFDTGLGATNYARLEMVNGTTLWQGGSLTIGANGTMLASNTTATIQGYATNFGNILVVNALATWASNVVLNGGVFVAQNATNQFNGGLSVASGQTLSFTNGNSRMTGVVSNSAGSTIQAINSVVTWQDAVVIGGRYFSDPSTNIFTTNVTVTASGSMYGSNGDLFVFYRDFRNQSTVNTNFSLWQAAVLFTNGAGTSNHTYDVTGSGSANWGTGFTNFDRVSTNFAIGQLSIAPGNRLMITGQVGGGITNALYVGWLDIQNWSTNNLATAYLSVSNSLVGALSLPDINIYYDKTDMRNQWLNDWIPGTGYQLWGANGGLLLPIPEPSAFAAALAGLGLLAFFRRRPRA